MLSASLNKTFLSRIANPVPIASLGPTEGGVCDLVVDLMTQSIHFIYGCIVKNPLQYTNKNQFNKLIIEINRLKLKITTTSLLTSK